MAYSRDLAVMDLHGSLTWITFMDDCYTGSFLLKDK